MIRDELYSDGVGEITVTGSVVRVDLMSLSPSERDASNNPKSTFRQRLIFPVDGFANSVEVMQKALQGLVDAGVIERKTNTPSKNPSVELVSQRVVEATRPENVSPNFKRQ